MRGVGEDLTNPRRRAQRYRTQKEEVNDGTQQAPQKKFDWKPRQLSLKLIVTAEPCRPFTILDLPTAVQRTSPGYVDHIRSDA